MKKELARPWGAHMSISGGIENAPLNGAKVGCAAMQIFTKNSNRWVEKNPSPASVEAYFRNIGEAGIGIVASHDSYLINLASPDPALRRRSFEAFVDEIERAGQLQIPYLIFHPGSHLGSGEEAGLAAVAECMNEAIKMTPRHEGVQLVVETTAGQGTNLGYRFEHIAYLIDRVKNKKRVGVCFDTCHVFAAGYELRTGDGFRKTFREFDSVIGLEYLKFFHINDSKKDLGCRVDRHEKIGGGCLGLSAFELLVNDKRFFKIPMVLETPKGPDLREDMENLATLKKLIR